MYTNNEKDNEILNDSVETSMENNENTINIESDSQNPNDSDNDLSSDDFDNMDGKKPLIITFSIVIIILVITGAGAIFGNSTGKKFVNLLTKNQKIVEVLNTDDRNSQVNSKIKIDIDNIFKSFGGQATGLGVLKIDTVDIVKNDDYSVSSVVSLDSLKDNNIEFQIVKTDNIVGLNIPQLTEKFIGVDIEDIDGLINNLKKIGLIDADVKKEKYDKNQRDELREILEKYLDVISKNIGDFIEKESNVEVFANGKTDEAKEYKFILNGESLVKIGVIVEKELLKSKSDIKKLVEFGFIDNADEFIEKLKENIEYNEKVIKEQDYNSIYDGEIIIKVYEKDRKNIATVLEFNNMTLGFYVFENSKDNYELVLMATSGSNEIVLSWTMEKNNVITNSNINLKMNYDGKTYDVKLCDIEVKELRSIKDEIITISKDNVLLLNSATKKDLEEFYEDVKDNLEEFLEQIMVSSTSN